jgi:enoyl-CoA hydratase/carnithine racemase
VARAKELIFRAKRLGADEALGMGLVSHVVPEEQLLERALEICKDIAANVRNILLCPFTDPFFFGGQEKQ